MENSNVIANPDPQVVEKIIKPVEKKTAAKKPAVKKTTEKAPCKTAAKKPASTAKKATASKPATTQKPAQKPAVKPVKNKNNFARVSFGESLPYYLL